MWFTGSPVSRLSTSASNRRRCAAEWKGNRYSNEKLHSRLGWKPKVKMADAMKLYLAQFEHKSANDF